MELTMRRMMGFFGRATAAAALVLAMVLAAGAPARADAPAASIIPKTSAAIAAALQKKTIIPRIFSSIALCFQRPVEKRQLW